MTDRAYHREQDASNPISPDDARWDPIPDDAWSLNQANEAPFTPAVNQGQPADAARPAQYAQQATTAQPVNQARLSSDQTVVGAHAWAGSRRAAERGAARAASTRFSTAEGSTPVTSPTPLSARHRTDQGGGGRDATGSGGRPARRRAPKRARHGCLSMVLWLIMLVVIALMAMRCIPAEYATGNMLPEIISFVPLLFAPIIVCLILALWWRRRVLCVVTAAALGVMAWWHIGYLVPTARVSDTATETVQTTASTDDNVARIMTLNTLNGNASAEEIVALCRAQNVEILCLQELTDDMVTALQEAGIDEILPYSVVSAGASSVSNGGRNGIWTLAPMSNISYNLLPIETSSMPAGTIQIGDIELRIVSVHPNSPVRGAEDLWESGLSTIGSLSDYDHSYLIMGDFNSTWDHAHFRELLGESFVDAGEQAGEGFHMTYPANSIIPAVLEIDHIVYQRDSGIVVSDLETVEISGTDHLALLATLEAS